jgi:hypothetical protein
VCVCVYNRFLSENLGSHLVIASYLAIKIPGSSRAGNSGGNLHGCH